MPLNNSEYVPGEEIIFEIRPSAFIVLLELLGLIVGVLGIMSLFYFGGFRNAWLYIATTAAGVFAAAIIYLYWRSIVYRLTSKRVESRVGILGSHEEEISHDDIQAVDSQQTIVGKLFNFGTVVIKAAGSSREVDFVNIANPKMVADKIEDLAIIAGRRRRPNNPQ